MDIRKKILKLAQDKRKFKTAEIAEALNLSRQYVSRILNGLVHEGKLIRGGSANKAFYALPQNASLLGNQIKKYLKSKDLKEHEVVDEIERQAPFLNRLKENVKSIFTYAFSEMLNNAIEHSRSEDIEVTLTRSNNYLIFKVRDFGIGVFRNVMKKRGLTSELEAIQDLLKGKTTTAPKAHTGEGIFFTSKASDIFILESFNYRLRIDNKIKDVFVEEVKNPKKGTLVIFTINTGSTRHLNDIFKKYQSNPEEYAFDKTEIQVKLYTMGTIYISRSQARRILAGLDKFKSIVLDFDKVPTVGQAFADEIFRVFQSKYPEIKLTARNMNEAVAFMVKRVESPKA